MMEEYKRKKEEQERKREVRKNGTVYYKAIVLLNHAKIMRFHSSRIDGPGCKCTQTFVLCFRNT